MRQEKNNIFAGIDWILVFFYVIFVGFGWLNIYATSKTDEDTQIFDFTTKYGKQLLWVGLSIPLIVFILFFNSKFYERYASIFYLIAIVLLLLLFPFGKEINGAKAWFNFGSMSLQPAEFVKAFTSLAIAKLLSDRQYNLKLVKNQIKAFIVVFFPAILIILQPDPGSALIYLSFFLVLNREGLTLNYIIFGVLSISLFILTILFGTEIMLIWLFSILTLIVIYLIFKGGKRLIRFNWHKILITYLMVGLFIYGTGFVYENVFKQHHRDRFEVLLGMKIDTKNIGYNSYQSELTISSGGFFGKGFLNGDITRGNFVPEQHTDYIFSTVGEEWGFLGSALVIIIFMLMIARIIYLSETHANKFGRIYGYGVASILFFHVTVNIGMVVGLLPTVGIPLPFFSYGGSSLWGFTILLFIFIRLDAHKNYDW
ncbi:MAG: rod shape-determining protein RodA [Flavobacteriia bacterium]|nr:rod shape-determining protein RodA [Flavobacteriia bacterium]OIP45971.1 MAG: rod shape-determining protein RodA [Flavobacteriaceae bacterium CG2_30_31_66]PIV95889.1 MAG: rod shape-determining protein RodA [Flavobacteriaceae bacterium CG17_big_fil_post_rev_8_21_14_2_50_31_13]PIX14333.1 MAG: rod shape-determining protein RodA [Flavobacteriaceae bacterium CG_4_8_14_3_um_filter_31_8]PIY15374.1 MAG: rod shape-determining protein RodA [Flavobacteriaceae bacterium CG_4_10_14_3_um_filter_31_253]PIZ